MQKEDLDYEVHLLVDGRSIDTGEPIIPLKASMGREKKWIWLFNEAGVNHQVEIVKKGFWGKHLIYLDGKLVGTKYILQNSRFEYHQEEMRLSIQFRYDLIMEEYRYHLVVNHKLIETGRTVEIKENDEKKAIEKLEKEPFVERLKMALLILIAGSIGFYLIRQVIGHELLGWAEDRPFIFHTFLPAFIAGGKLLNVRTLGSLFIYLLTLIVIFFAVAFLIDLWHTS